MSDYSVTHNVREMCETSHFIAGCENSETAEKMTPWQEFSQIFIYFSVLTQSQTPFIW